MSDRRDGMIRLVRGAAMSGKTYGQMLTAVLRKTARGYQDANGHWWVSEADARKLAREREPAPTSSSA